MKLKKIASELDGTLIGDASLLIKGINTLDQASNKEIAPILEQRYGKEASSSKAIAFITFKKLPTKKAQIIVKDPRKALAQAIALLHPETPPSAPPTTPIDSSATIHESATISPFCTIGKNTRIGKNVIIHNGVHISENCSIQDNGLIYPNVTILRDTHIGKSVIIHPGAVIGSDGFGYYNDQGQFKKIPHIGQVIIEDNVEIGANTCIDRGCLDKTLIKKGSKIDNLVHISHNSIVGSNCAIAAQVGFSGGTILGDHVMMGGQSSIDGTEIGNHVIICGKSGVTTSIPDNTKVSGFPAWEHKNELKTIAKIRKLIN